VMSSPQGSPPALAAEPAVLLPPIPTAPADAGSPAPGMATVILEHPEVTDTANLASNGRSVQLLGLIGLSGAPAQELGRFIAETGNRVTCQPQAVGQHLCLLPDGRDVALVVLANGAALTTPDAPAGYREQEAVARTARRGVWATLRRPRVTLHHPEVRDTGTIVADGRTYKLSGVQGLGGKPAHELQAYLAANGDAVTCQLPDESGRYLCLLPDGTDLAKVALVNGAARVTADAPDAYRVQQGLALANHRGIWSARLPEYTAPMRGPVGGPVIPPMPAPQMGVAESFDPSGEDDASIAFVDGQPTAVIAGEAVVMVYGGAAGWGYWDHYRRWHGAPGHYAGRLERYRRTGAPGAGYAHRPGWSGDPRAFHPAMPGHAGPPRQFARPEPVSRPAAFGPHAAPQHFAAPARMAAAPRPAPAPARPAPSRSCSRPHC
jgi:endonuclease YncB( thermonuclease family)